MLSYSFHINPVPHVTPTVAVKRGPPQMQPNHSNAVWDELGWLKWGTGGRLNRPPASTRLVKVEARIQFAVHKGAV